MVRLFCVIVGVAGSAFSVEIGRDQTVGDLKEAVKTKNKIKLKNVDAGDLQLFLTMLMDGEWLRSDASDVISMRSGAIPEQVRKLMNEEIDPAEGIGELFGNDPPKKTIHVLVRVPDYDSDSELIQQRKRKPLEKLLKESKTNGELPQKGDFLKLFDLTDADIGKVLDIKAIGDIVGFTGSDFYIRKEILCVLENFKKIYHDEFDTGATTTCSKQFILMGSPGTGKSCILALISFYIAVVYDRPVVWHRQVEAGFGVGTSTRLFYQGKYYEWDDAGAITYADFYHILQVSGANVKRCWFCLDGMSQKQIRQKSLFNLFRLLTTSGHYSVKAEASEFLELCLVPYWRQVDLEDFGKHEGMLESDVAARFFESGGSLRDFHQLNFAHVKGVLGSIQSSSHAMSLLTNAGLRDVKEIDCIRMRGVENRNNADHYVDMDMWTCCVTSQAVLKAIAHALKPKFFEKMKKVAMGMDDKRLEGVAFEGYFHVLVRHHQPIRVKFRRYDNGNHRDYPNWKNITGEPNVIDCNQLSLNNEIKVLTTGKNMEDCVAEMEEWAANPSKMDYWTPATSLCDTIDAVAKWTLPDDEEHFCLLQLTMATKQKCDEEVLWKLAQPFVAKQLNVCYIALLHDEAQLFQFRLDPVQIKKREILDNVPLYVGHFEKVDVSDFIARESKSVINFKRLRSV